MQFTQERPRGQCRSSPRIRRSTAGQFHAQKRFGQPSGKAITRGERRRTQTGAHRTQRNARKSHVTHHRRARKCSKTLQVHRNSGIDLWLSRPSPARRSPLSIPPQSSSRSYEAHDGNRDSDSAVSPRADCAQSCRFNPIGRHFPRHHSQHPLHQPLHALLICHRSGHFQSCPWIRRAPSEVYRTTHRPRRRPCE